MSSVIISLLYLLQLEEYEELRVKEWLKKNSISNLKPVKKKISWTLKIKILYVVSVFLHWLNMEEEKAVFAALKILSVPENLIRKAIVFLAKAKIILSPKLKVVAITGSYGKTSVKEFLKTILQTKFSTFATPNSYNTTIGIASSIIKNFSWQKIAIIEMGAYHIGDIKKLCGFIKPDVSILTSIGKQHLERFKSVENILLAKSEIYQDLSENKTAVVNLDDQNCIHAAKNIQAKKITISLDKNTADLYASQIEVDTAGSSFTLVYQNRSVKCQTIVLGKHNLINILLASAAAISLGLTLDEIAQGIQNIKPVPHRLQIIPNNSGAIIIDNAYNSNPDSARAAIDALLLFKNRKKIIITPGLVELGEIQEKENIILGELIAKHADNLIIVGNTNRVALEEGFQKANSQKAKMFFCPTLNEASSFLKEFMTSDSVVLFENDLPDQYL